MKIKELKLTNFAKYDEVEVSFDQNVTYLIGENGAGKSTLGLTAIWFMFKGILEKSSDKTVLFGERFRFIGDSGRAAVGEMVLYDEKLKKEIKVIRRLTKDGTTLSFEAPDDTTLTQQWLDDLFNIFLINPKKFTQLNSKEQALALGINTETYDNKLQSIRSELSILHTQKSTYEETLKSFRNIPEGDIIDIDEIKGQIQRIKQENHKADQDYQLAYKTAISQITAFNTEQAQRRNEISNTTTRIEQLKTELKAMEDKLASLPAPLPTKGEPQIEKPTLQSTELLEHQLEEAITHNASLAAKTTNDEIKGSVKTITEKIEVLKSSLSVCVEERLKYIKNYKVPQGVTINEKGELLLKDKPIREPYFSTGELVRIIPILMSTQNPELKFVFLQDFNNLDEANRNKIIEYLTGQGYQLVIELVGDKKIPDKNCILLKSCQVIEEQTENEPKLFD